MTTTYRAYGPNGERIVGILETLTGNAEVEFFTLESDGIFHPEYQGYTEIHYESQVTFVENGQRKFYDQNKMLWPESQVTFVPVDPEPPQVDTAWENNEIQFPRLIAELEAAAAFTPEVLDALSASMDLDPSEVHELIERAVTSWDHIVRNTSAPAPAGE